MFKVILPNVHLFAPQRDQDTHRQSITSIHKPIKSGAASILPDANAHHLLAQEHGKCCTLTLATHLTPAKSVAGLSTIAASFNP